MIGKFEIAAVQARFVAIRVGHGGLQIVADNELRHAAQKSEEVDMRSNPIGDLFARARLDENVVGRAHGGDEELHRADFAGCRIDDIDRVAREIDEHLLAGHVGLPHGRPHSALEGGVLLAKPAVAEAVRMGGPILFPQERQGDAAPAQFLFRPYPVRNWPSRGLEAQQKAVTDYLNGGNWTVTAEFVEVETGKRNDRPQLQLALAACRKHKAKLVIAKLDRLSRNLAFIATLMDAGTEFVAVDNPHANPLTLHILAAVAQHEREMIAARTKAALQASKARGTCLGRNGAEVLAPAHRAAAEARAKDFGPIVSELLAKGMSAGAIARELEARKVPTPKGGRWHAATVLRIVRRLA